MNEGKKDRRDPIRTIKARNPVAKNATAAIGGGAAGAHKDKKKAMKQGDVKHKKSEFAESYEDRLARQLEEATVNPQFINVQVTKILAREAQRMTNASIEQLLAPLMKEYNLTVQQIDKMVPGGLKKAAGEYGVTIKPQVRNQGTAKTDDAFRAHLARQRAEKEQGTQENVEEEPGQHRVAVKVTDPNTQDDIQKVVRVHANNEHDAIEKAEAYYTKKGMYVVNAKYLGIVDQSVAEEMDIPQDGTPEYDQFINRGGVNQKTPFDLGGADAYYGRQHDITAEYGFQKGSPEWDEYIDGYRDTYQNKDMRKDYGGGRSSSVHPRRITKTPEAMNGITGPGMMDYRPTEEFDSPEYNDEAGMAQGNLYTISKAAQGLLDTIDDQDNLPEWAQEKIAKVEGMLVTVWNYLQSQKSQGIDPKVSEAQSALEKFRKGSAERNKKHADIEAKRKAAPPGSGMKSAIDRLEKQVKSEGWTHDSLADQLFEHERTYEEKLANDLNRKLGK